MFEVDKTFSGKPAHGFADGAAAGVGLNTDVAFDEPLSWSVASGSQALLDRYDDPLDHRAVG